MQLPIYNVASSWPCTFFTPRVFLFSICNYTSTLQYTTKVKRLELKIKFEFKKGVGITIKSKETSSHLANSQLSLTSQLQLCTTCVYLNTIATGQLCTSMHTFYIAYLQDLIPILAGVYCLYILMPAKVGIKSCRCAKKCVSFVHGCSQLSSCNCVQADTCSMYVDKVGW